MNVIMVGTGQHLMHLLNYDKQFGQHNLKAMAGWHTEKYDYSYTKAYRKIFLQTI